MSDTVKLARDLVSNLGHKLGVGELKLDDDGFCSLQFDGRITLTVFTDASGEQLVLSTELGEIPADRLAEICQAMLSANYAWGETGGVGTLSLAPSNSPLEARRACMMHQAQTRFLNDGSFHNLFETFVNSADAWMEYLGSYQAESADVSNREEVTEPAAGGMMRI